MIPVSSARCVGEDNKLSGVVILGYGPAREKLHVATWGRDPTDKERCVSMRDRCVDALGLDPTAGATHQDYRFQTEGERALVVDQLVRACRAADHAIASLICERNGITDELLHDVRNALKMAIDAA